MKSKTVFIADDGMRYDTKAEAQVNESLTTKIARAIAPLGPRPRDPKCEFDNGGGYLPHDPAVVLACRVDVVKILKVGPLKQDLDLCGEPHMHQGLPLEQYHPMGWLGRVIDDSDLPRAVKDAWYRFQCIDDQGREWGQVYFALNPTKGTQRIWESS